ncbi:coronatine-insensitive protein homolog 1b [Physcomitrium patens]|uniref:Uncharacterized protein n=1 Tax=Physcomitrium patens TaxID=3218 RepID=A9S5F2_PHYPA|nr:coronatine-insensitive protein homolog 1b-like isoform X1 [Physcomitrium patens]XP_024362336.1 coronatine-insensitive protein homolog 1b-like isoform X1 [Physcomitrium patens]XP_024362337.1 coronatine-insensitive protein homolog 1b-like isoform X1 [Physcomitrium patens]XP_024362338.1 coronatine-insensitive protein homolog 1b-like isoform X1 [Physcomitrium patens]|eukprot:XP_024362335.1 coronatine-insensitive protein homolog 1b-like isoform X1 [Physcomitrella patens]
MAAEVVWREDGNIRSRFFRGNEHGPTKKCIFNQLPESVIELIFDRLGSKGDRRAISQVCKQWHRVDGLTRKNIYIFNCYSIAPSNLSKRFPNLEKIKIKGKPRAYEFGLLVESWGAHAGPWIEEIASVYPNLEGLALRRMDITDKDLMLLASRCPNLRKLKLHKCSGFSTRGLEFITRSCRTLRVLDIDESHDMEDTGGPWLQLLEKGDGKLESLNIASAGLEEESIKEVLLKLAPSLKCISSLRVSDMELGSFFKILDNSEVPVVELGLGCYSLSQEDPKELVPSFSSRLSKLKILDLKFTTLNAEIQIELLRHCCSVEELELRSVVGDWGMQVISENCKQLKKIRVDQDTSPYMTNHVTQKGMISICEGCRELDFLVMYLTDVNNAALAAVGQYLPKLSDFRIVLLEDQDDVEDLPLDDGIRLLLQGCPMLSRFSVYLRPGGLSNKGLGYIGEFGSKLKWVLLGSSGESDEGFRLMAEGCRQLERLELRNCPFSDKQLAISILNNLPHLKYLWVQGFGATSGLGVALVTQMPGFVVEVMATDQQILGYYTVTHPRTDSPDSVCVINYDPLLDNSAEVCEEGSQGDACSYYAERLYSEHIYSYLRVDEEAPYPGVNKNSHLPKIDENTLYSGVVGLEMYLAGDDNSASSEFCEDSACIC